MDIKVLIALHKEYDVPSDEMYLPLHVGAEGKKDLGYKKDNTGENISIKNPNYCELTGLYWGYKNLDVDYLGLVHYRRHLSLKKKSKIKIENVITKEEVEHLLSKTDVILPKKRHYIIETLYNHYKHTMYIEPLDITANIIKEKYPEYMREFNKLKKRRSAHMFNMFIMKKEILDQYCDWLFDILFELEKQIDVSIYDSFHARFFGRISELLLDVWLNTNNISYKEVNCIYLEKINWFKKGTSFIKAKFLGEKYGKSF